jgi:hypothetical protein
MRCHPGVSVFLAALASLTIAQPGRAGQSAMPATEIPMQRCDRLPVVVLQVDKEDKRFLVDTAATSFLNAKSFSSAATRPVRIQSWNETTAFSASSVSIGELSLGSRVIRNVKLPAIDLSAISKACGGQLDGILGVDLLEQLGMTIDLKRSVARLGASADTSSAVQIADLEKAIESCSAAFNSANGARLASCFDPEFVLSSPRGELHGRDQAMNYFQQYFSASPHAHLSMSVSEERDAGGLVWSFYGYTIETASQRKSGRGMMLCRKSDNHWSILSMHEWPSADAETPAH